ncbi:MAG: hypothetical protein EXR02_05025 [Rhodospirillales bacterium]|nr:hypothetical protein [Rhodospirillales bacterium]MSP80419.1 hypothetical protein [Rhodospirillales bacterium]
MTRWFFLPAFLLAALPIALVWGLAGHPIEMPPPAAGMIPCVSYTPFRGNQTPFDPALVVAPAGIEDDFGKLAAFGIRCVRTYSVDQGLENVPEIAARHGMSVLLGAWIGRDDAKNRRQLETAVRPHRQPGGHDGGQQAFHGHARLHPETADVTPIRLDFDSSCPRKRASI